MKKIVLTGGPCGGKTTVKDALRDAFPRGVLFVPEAATLLLTGGIPVPGKHLAHSPEWQDAFQPAVVAVQLALEETYLLLARERGCRLLVCDRALLDGSAYTPGGIVAFCDRYRIDLAATLARYEVVLHLESRATADPQGYGTAGNETRYESLEEACRVEYATRAAWAGHPRQQIIDGSRGLEGKVAAAVAVVRALLEERE